jgi:tetratricopeptide (TPR) repeat protein
MLATIIVFVTARYRIAFVPILTPFAGFAIWWWYEKIKIKNLQAISLTLIPLLFFFSLAYHRAIEGIFASYIHPDGFHIQREDGLIVRDDSGLLHGKEVYMLQSPNDMIKKELVIKEDLSKFKEVTFYFDFEYASYIQKSQKSTLIFEVNGKEQEIDIVSNQLSSFCQVYFNPNDLNQGKNIAIIKPKARLDSIFRIKIDTQHSFGRSYFLNKNGKWEKLRNGEYMIGLILNPERSIRGYIDQGISYIEKGMYDEAISEFQQALSKDPKCPNVHYNLGIAYEKIGKLDKAIENYKRELIVAKEKEDLINTHDNLIRLYYAKGMWDEILKESEEIVKLDPNHINAHSNIAAIYYKKGMFKEAVIEFQKVLRLDSSNIYAKQMIEKISLDCIGKYTL